MIDVREYMDGYDHEFDKAEFENKLWEMMQEEDFEFTEEFEEFCKEQGILNIHDFLKSIRMRKKLGM